MPARIAATGVMPQATRRLAALNRPSMSAGTSDCVMNRELTVHIVPPAPAMNAAAPMTQALDGAAGSSAGAATRAKAPTMSVNMDQRRPIHRLTGPTMTVPITPPAPRQVSRKPYCRSSSPSGPPTA